MTRHEAFGATAARPAGIGLEPTGVPSPREYTALAYDPLTQSTLLFGGDVEGYVNGRLSWNYTGDTWAWDGVRWKQLSPAHSPPARMDQVMAYDAADQQVVLFGGDGDSNYTDTWTWNGTDWTQRQPSVSPPNLQDAQMAYDAAMGELILFGGTFASCRSYYSNQTWAWNGSNWALLNPSASPPGRTFAGMAYDAATSQVVLFGGEGQAGNLGDTWTWDGTTWTQRSPATSPPSSSLAQADYDSARSQVVLYPWDGLPNHLGDLWTWDGSNREGEPEPTRTYNSANASRAGPLGHGWSGSYFMSLTIVPPQGRNPRSIGITVNQENGSTVTFELGVNGFEAPSRVLATMVANRDGTLTFTRKDQTEYRFNLRGQLVSETDRNGYTTTLSYSSGRLTGVRDAQGRSLTFVYTQGLLTSVSDSEVPARRVGFSYDGSGNLTQATDVAGGTTTFAYDASHRMVTMKDPVCLGTAGCAGVRNVYDSLGRVTSQTDDLGRQTSLAYSPGQTTVTDPAGDVTLDRYQDDELVAETRGYGTPAAATTQHSYDATLGVTVTVDGRGNNWRYTHDPAGNVLSASDPLGKTTGYTYNRFSEVLTATDPLGVTTTYAYDPNGNLLERSRPLAGTGQVEATTYFYADPLHPGEPTSVTDAAGKTWTYTYDRYGDRASATDPLGDRTTYSYDSAGRLVALVSPDGNVAGGNPGAHTTGYAYNAFDERTLSTDPLGHQTSYRYDANGNLVQTMDANGQVTTDEYDLDNELTRVSRPDGSALTTAYDQDGHVASQTERLGHTTAYRYDAAGRRASMTDPLGRVTTFGYDGAGNLTSTVDARGLTTSYGYDGAGRLSSISYSDRKTAQVSFTYDADGQRQSMEDGTGTSSYVYDSLHRLTSATDGAGARVGYGYDLRGPADLDHVPGRGPGHPELRRRRAPERGRRLARPPDQLRVRRQLQPDPGELPERGGGGLPLRRRRPDERDHRQLWRPALPRPQLPPRRHRPAHRREQHPLRLRCQPAPDRRRCQRLPLRRRRPPDRRRLDWLQLRQRWRADQLHRSRRHVLLRRRRQPELAGPGQHHHQLQVRPGRPAGQLWQCHLRLRRRRPPHRQDRRQPRRGPRVGPGRGPAPPPPGGQHQLHDRARRAAPGADHRRGRGLLLPPGPARQHPRPDRRLWPGGGHLLLRRLRQLDWLDGHDRKPLPVRRPVPGRRVGVLLPAGQVPRSEHGASSSHGIRLPARRGSRTLMFQTAR